MDEIALVGGGAGGVVQQRDRLGRVATSVEQQFAVEAGGLGEVEGHLFGGDAAGGNSGGQAGGGVTGEGWLWASMSSTDGS